MYIQLARNNLIFTICNDENNNFMLLFLKTSKIHVCCALLSWIENMKSAPRGNLGFHNNKNKYCK
jgi:hypothetical protein